jgi:hypothetical protein
MGAVSFSVAFLVWLHAFRVNSFSGNALLPGTVSQLLL